MRRIQAAIISVLLVLGLTAAGWPTDHGDPQRSGWLPTQTRFHALTRAFAVTLDGAVYGSPILAGSSLIVATENNTVYALDANSGAQRWKKHLRTPVRRATLPCGNIDPLGITGTPTYDTATRRVFVVTESPDPTTVARHEIFGLDVTTGSVGMNRPIEVPGTDPKAEQQRAALANDGKGNIFVAFGGLAGDCANYRGAVISLKANGARGAKAYVVPTAREAGIWAAGGPVVGPHGFVYVSVGNGASTSAPYDYSDSVTALWPDMRRHDIFAPSTWAPDNASDLDLGSLSPVLTRSGYILQAGKSGMGYLLWSGHLGGVGGQKYQAPLCTAFGVAAVTGNIVYLPCSNGLTRVEVNSNATFTKKWTDTRVNGSPVVGNGAVFATANGSLYAVGSGDAHYGSIAVGTTTRFATPALGPNKVYVGTTTGVVGVNIG
jgi:outer membrane protein assembly factor BamB